MQQFKTLKKLYHNFETANPQRADLPEVLTATENIMDLYKIHILERKEFDEDKGWDKLSDLLSNLASLNELQGFIFGFRYAMRMIAECDLNKINS